MNDNKFELVSSYKPSGDQPKAIDQIINNFNSGIKQQVLLGATGTGKTFTIANIIKKFNKKTLLMVHNKTLAAQLYGELKELFPNNHVEYYISYFDFYQPEAYLPRTDTYIEKSSKVNSLIQSMRLSTINSLVNYDDVIVVASVASIYPSVAKEDFNRYKIYLKIGNKYDMSKFKNDLVRLRYERNDIDLVPSKFRFKGDVCDIFLGYETSYILRISFFDNEIESINKIDPLSNIVLEKLSDFTIYPADEYIANLDLIESAVYKIKNDLASRLIEFRSENKLLEAQRLEQRTNLDIESLEEFGYCNGSENYAIYLENRLPGSTPNTIFDFFNDDWLFVIDESHMSIPQIRGMYETDHSRKQTLVNFGFRLPSALDNRPLKFDEFNNKLDHVIYVSATPNEYEILKSNNHIVEQIVRPTGLLDPIIEIKDAKNQMLDLLYEIRKNNKNKQKTFINVLTIRMAEELTKFLIQNEIKTAYLHNELKTIERTRILNNLRRDLYDVIVGINLLREGIDIPEVSLVAILDADKSGFFRNEKSLIQIIGRAARNANGRVLMYCDNISDAMQKAIDETNRRRSIQLEYNKVNNITPQTIIKKINDSIAKSSSILLDDNSKNKKTKSKKDIIFDLRKQMLSHAKKREYEKAALVRDMILELESES